MKFLKAAVMVAALVVAGCAEDKPPVETNVNKGPAPHTLAYFNQVIGDRVLFLVDQYNLDPQAQATLDRQAEWLNANASGAITIEGHADERGTRQYNLALGARRANAVRQYLISRGVAADRLKAVTFGKERPEAVCSDESCWAQNRRAISVVTDAPSS